MSDASQDKPSFTTRLAMAAAVGSAVVTGEAQGAGHREPDLSALKPRQKLVNDSMPELPGSALVMGGGLLAAQLLRRPRSEPDQGK